MHALVWPWYAAVFAGAALHSLGPRPEGTYLTERTERARNGRGRVSRRERKRVREYCGKKHLCEA